jgi:hypothetical protein
MNQANSARVPAILLGTLYLGFLGYVFLSAGHLPERVATHFSLGGQPDGWMHRSTHLGFILAFGLVFPLLIVGLLYATRFLPVSIINIPRRDYWLAADRRAGTYAYLFRHSLWFACLGVAFITGVHHLVVRANMQPVARLSTWALLVVAGSFLVGLVSWIVAMICHFRKAPEESIPADPRSPG